MVVRPNAAIEPGPSTRISSASRPRPAQLLELPWVTRRADGAAAAAAAAATASAAAAASTEGAAAAVSGGGAAPFYSPLVEAHEKLNVWYDEFLFEGMTSRLAEMADG